MADAPATAPNLTRQNSNDREEFLLQYVSEKSRDRDEIELEEVPPVQPNVSFAGLTRFCPTARHGCSTLPDAMAGLGDLAGEWDRCGGRYLDLQSPGQKAIRQPGLLVPLHGRIQHVLLR